MFAILLISILISVRISMLEGMYFICRMVFGSKDYFWKVLDGTRELAVWWTHELWNLFIPCPPYTLGLSKEREGVRKVGLMQRNPFLFGDS